jgi:hypothetical protein
VLESDPTFPPEKEGLKYGCGLVTDRNRRSKKADNRKKDTIKEAESGKASRIQTKESSTHGERTSDRESDRHPPMGKRGCMKSEVTRVLNGTRFVKHTIEFKA